MRIFFTLLILAVSSLKPSDARLVENINMGAWDGRHSLVQESSMCFRALRPPVSISLAGMTPNGDFQLSNGRHSIDYEVHIKSDQFSQELAPLQRFIFFNYGNRRQARCQQGIEVNMLILISQLELQGKPAGTYNGALQITVSPE